MRKRLQSGVTVLLVICGGVIVWGWIRHTNNENPTYSHFLQTERFRDRFARYQFSPTYRTVSRITGFDPYEHFRREAQQEELDLLRSGRLISVTFWAPCCKTLKDVHTPKKFIKVTDARDAELIGVVCLPENVSALLSTCCCVTNRVPIAPLTRLAGFNAEDISCRLPDESVVDLDTLQKWLNDSVGAGWTVGVACKYDPARKQSLLLATRNKLQLKP